MSLGRTRLWIYLAAALVAAASVVFLYFDFMGYAAWNRRLMQDRGNTILDSLAAGIRSQSRMGRYEADRLASIFEELAAAPNILGVRLEDEAGTVMAAGGEDTGYPTPRPRLPVWRGWTLCMAKDVRFLLEQQPPRRGGGRGPGPGMRRRRPFDEEPGHGEMRGPDGAEHGGEGRGHGREPGVGPPFGRMPGPAEIGKPWSPGDYRLSVCLDVTELDRAFRRGLINRIVIECGVILAILLGAAVASARVRHRALEQDLGLAREQAVHLERLARLGAGLAHETKNPLGVVRGLAQSIGETEGASGPIKRMTHNIVDEVDRTVGQINTFLTFARPKEVEWSRLDVDRFFEEFLPLLRAEAQGSKVEIRYHPTGLTVMADEHLLRRAILNLAINGLRACGGKGVVTIAGSASGSTAALCVTDTGCGMAAEDVARATEPYFSRFEGGCGLGLAIVEDIVRAHGWTLGIESEQGKGARVSLAGMRVAEDEP
ncbi:MAG: hypothetical protein GY851_19175 [bacterium]|nr:hypothetical protein [bacterium]